MPKSPKPQVEIYQIKITLVGSHPSIWRRVEVEGNITLAALHRVIQTAMGWTNAHLHRYIIKGRTYELPERSVTDSNRPEDERNFTLQELATEEGARVTYEYDFGDNWQHELAIEKVHPAQEGMHYPRCLEGEGACPPEDVGGISGYEHFLDAIGDPRHPEHQDYRTWIGSDFNPKRFDLPHINHLLQKIQPR